MHCNYCFLFGHLLNIHRLFNRVVSIISLTFYHQFTVLVSRNVKYSQSSFNTAKTTSLCNVPSSVYQSVCLPLDIVNRIRIDTNNVIPSELRRKTKQNEIGRSSGRLTLWCCFCLRLFCPRKKLLFYPIH